jgi:hypothetical protein
MRARPDIFLFAVTAALFIGSLVTGFVGKRGYRIYRAVHPVAYWISVATLGGFLAWMLIF